MTRIGTPPIHWLAVAAAFGILALAPANAHGNASGGIRATLFTACLSNGAIGGASTSMPTPTPSYLTRLVQRHGGSPWAYAETTRASNTIELYFFEFAHSNAAAAVVQGLRTRRPPRLYTENWSRIAVVGSMRPTGDALAVIHSCLHKQAFSRTS